MAADKLTIISQFNFVEGPNFTEPIWQLGKNELGPSYNMWWDGKLRSFPGAGLLTNTGAASRIDGLAVYSKANETNYLVALNAAGNALAYNGTTWSTIGTGLSSVQNTGWSFRVFDDTLIMANRYNTVRSWDGTTFGALGGTPPDFAFLESHVDYLLGAGQLAARSDLNYSDTATATSWPVGNVLHVGLDDGQVITGLQHWGDVTVIFKDRSIWTLSGTTPDDFDLEKSPSEVGCVAPNTILPTELGVFFWSEGGPAIFNGYRTFLLTDKLRGIMDAVDWDVARRFCAGYYPYYKHIVVSFGVEDAGENNRLLLIDMRNLDKEGSNLRLPRGLWPGHLASASGTTAIATGRLDNNDFRTELYLGTAGGHVLQWNTGQDYDGTFLQNRITTRGFRQDRRDKVLVVRHTDLHTEPTPLNVTLNYSTNLSSGLDGSYTAHGTQSNTNASADLHMLRFKGDGAGNHIIGRQVAYYITATPSASAYPFVLQGIEVGVEPGGGTRDGE